MPEWNYRVPPALQDRIRNKTFERCSQLMNVSLSHDENTGLSKAVIDLVNTGALNSTIAHRIGEELDPVFKRTETPQIVRDRVITQFIEDIGFLQEQGKTLADWVNHK
jgi:hypothetical protein